MWNETKARARITDSCLFRASQALGLTGSDHKKRPSRSISPDSSRVSQTLATWCGVKCKVGSGSMAGIGLSKPYNPNMALAENAAGKPFGKLNVAAAAAAAAAAVAAAAAAETDTDLTVCGGDKPAGMGSLLVQRRSIHLT